MSNVEEMTNNDTEPSNIEGLIRGVEGRGSTPHRESCYEGHATQPRLPGPMLVDPTLGDHSKFDSLTSLFVISSICDLRNASFS
jgi:hypothetical protein